MLLHNNRDLKIATVVILFARITLALTLHELPNLYVHLPELLGMRHLRKPCDDVLEHSCGRLVARLQQLIGWCSSPVVLPSLPRKYRMPMDST